MNFLKRQTTWSNGEISIIKIGVFTAGMLGGYYGRNYLAGYSNLIWLVSTFTCLIALYLWAVKSRRKRS